MLGDVEEKVPTHRAEADHSELCFRHISVSQMLHERVLEIPLDLVVNGQLAIGVLLRLAKDVPRTLTAQKICDQHAMLTEDERVERQRILLLVLHDGDLFAAAGTVVAVVEPSSLHRGS